MTSSATSQPFPPLASTPSHAPAYMRLHLWLYRITGGRIGGSLNRNLRFLVLTTTGRKSGKRYAIPLQYHTDGATPYIIGSNSGSERPPAWYFNLQANPLVEVERNGQRTWATARIATATERQRLWPDLVQIAPHYARYQRRLTREIPLVLLESAPS